MKMPFCVACGRRQNLHHHHLVPKSQGGSNSDKNLITLCSAHHLALHAFSTSAEHSALVKAGIEKAKQRGVFLGPKPPDLDAFSDSKESRTPIDEVLVHLFAEAKLPIGLLTTLRWVDIIGGEITLPSGLTERLPPQTQSAIRRVIDSGLVAGPALATKISATTKSPEGASDVALAQRLSRLKNQDARRGLPRGPTKLAPLSRVQALEVARKISRQS